MSSVRALLHPGWFEAQLADYSGFDDLWDELETLRLEGRYSAALLSGDAFANQAPPLTPHHQRTLRLIPLPTIFALLTPTGGPAAQLALSCDIRIAAASATLTPPADTPALATLLGPSRQPATRYTAEEALAAGLVSRTLPTPDATLAEGRRLAAVIASRGPIAVRLAKEAIWRGLELPLEHALRFETDLTLLLQSTKDRAEGVDAFLHKRQPNFTGE